MATRQVGEDFFIDLDAPGADMELPVVKNQLYGELWAPRDLSEYAALAQAQSVPERAVSAWRGQSDATWPLHSGAVRRLKNQSQAWLLDSANVTENVVRDYESRLLDRARLAGHGFADGRRLSDLELMGILQHHGAATRLVDFTGNAFIALWFACRTHLDNYGIVFGAELDYAREVDKESTLGDSFQTLLDAAKDQMTYWRPSALSPRMPAQSGLLVWSEVQGRDWSSLGTVTGEANDADRSVLSSEFIGIAVSPQLKRFMKERWREVLGYSEESMFPDLDGFANTHGARQELTWQFYN